MHNPTLIVGEWIEREARDVRQSPSYYAADHETIRTRPGRYALRVTITGGYIHPMPQWALVRIDGDRIDGRLYSGAAGLNFASTELPKEPAPVHVQANTYMIKDMVARGEVELKPEFAELGVDYLEWARKQTWETIRAMVYAQREVAAA